MCFVSQGSILDAGFNIYYLIANVSEFLVAKQPSEFSW